MAVMEHIVKELEELGEHQLAEGEDYLTYLEFRSRLPFPPAFNKDAIAGLYREFDAEDRSSAEEGMAEHARDAAREDMSGGSPWEFRGHRACPRTRP
jgi:hypothetical protein